MQAENALLKPDARQLFSEFLVRNSMKRGIRFHPVLGDLMERMLALDAGLDAKKFLNTFAALLFEHLDPRFITFVQSQLELPAEKVGPELNDFFDTREDRVV